MTYLRRASKEIEHIALGEGDWVDLRVLNFADRQAIMAALVDPDTEEISRERVAIGNAIELVRAIVAWGGPGFGCTCAGGCRCDAGKPSHANDCHVWAITIEEVSGLNETGDVILRLVDAKQDKARRGADPFVLPRPTSPSSAGAAVAAPSPPSSTNGPSSENGTSTPEQP